MAKFRPILGHIHIFDVTTGLLHTILIHLSSIRLVNCQLDMFQDEIHNGLYTQKNIKIQGNLWTLYRSLYPLITQNVFKRQLSLYRTTNNQTDTFNRQIKQISEILKKYQWNESLKGFKLISFFDIRRSIIPEILSLYNSENNEIQS